MVDFKNFEGRYFSNSDRYITIKKGEIFIAIGDFNNRLFYVKSGKFSVYDKFNDREYKINDIVHGMLMGLYSFFSGDNRSAVKIICDEDSTISWIDEKVFEKEFGDTDNLYKVFMSYVVKDLYKRQKRNVKIRAKNDDTKEKLYRSEKMASLGQMAAGLAHELNNSIAVLKQGSLWLKERLSTMISNDNNMLIEEASKTGRIKRGSEVRKEARGLEKKYKISKHRSQLIAELTDFIDLKKLLSYSEEDLKKLNNQRELGTTIKDMLLSARQASHVVNSINQMARGERSKNQKVDINSSIDTSLVLLKSILKDVEIVNNRDNIKPIDGNSGDMVQIFTNIIKNGVEAFPDTQENKRVSITTKLEGEIIFISISNNGPEIPEDIKNTIFQPNFTTKVDGMSFGLGLGLSIVSQVIETYGGEITLTSNKEETTFNIKLPIKE
ncbi:MAG: hypothetical protein CR982_04040 [Candidatus Cloacimonadota bacterium]|nr:MAG: hypothetical protein CR982_04040 [Candidatus Cloacimonadota bacterium]PIE77478.1 MAG: hypothetical protein CSA15_12740 [Candidatus Delongbacteria bacterium]